MKPKLFKETIKTNIKLWIEIVFVLMIVSVLSAYVLNSANPFLNPPGRDGGFFNYVGKALNSGGKLYEDIWDSKGPLIFWINSLGMGNSYNRRGVFLIEMIFLVLGLFIAYLGIKKIYGKLPALISVFTVIGLLSLVIGAGNSIEEYSLLFSWIAVGALVLFITKPKNLFLPLFIMGMSISLNVLLRANTIGTQAMVILVAFIVAVRNRKEINVWKLILFLIIGMVAIFLPVCLYFIANGTLKAMLEASFLYNYYYSTMQGTAFSSVWTPAYGVFGYWTYVFIGLWVVCIIVFVKKAKQKMVDPFMLLTILSFPIEWVMSSVSGKGYGHYFICWIPACTLLLAFAFSVINKEVISEKFLALLEEKRPLLSLAIILAITLVPTHHSFHDATTTIRSIMFHPEVKQEFSEPVANAIQGFTTETDKVLVFGGQAGINIMAKRDSINTALFYPMINDSPIGLEVQNKFFETLKKERPKLIIDGHRFFSQRLPAIDPITRQNQIFLDPLSQNVDMVLDWINNHYTKFDEANGYIIYMIRNPEK